MTTIVSDSDNSTRLRPNRLKTRANLAVVGGIVIMFTGSGVAQQGPESFSLGAVVLLCGWALMVWGCENYVRWKGYSGWLGLFGYLLVPGLVILACLPNRRKRVFDARPPGPIAEIEVLSEADRKPGNRFLLTLAPIGALFVILGGLLFLFRSNVDSAEWKEISQPEIGFQALMPGTPQVEQRIQQTPAGNVELNRLTVKPKGKKETFMVVSIRFPEAASRALGGKEKLLELGRKDVLAASQGRLQSEKQIVSGGCPGLELEVLPPGGAIIKARIYSTDNQCYQASAYVSQFRAASRDVQKFLDSFKLLANSGTASDRRGM